MMSKEVPVTITGDWDQYHEKCYPGGIPNSNQHDQLKIAFFSGAFAGISNIIHHTEHMDEEASLQYLKDRITECEAFLTNYALKKKRN
jgi:siderophore synthetase component